MRETEIKLKIPNVVEAQQKLKEIGFEAKTLRTFEDNWVFDFPDSSLRRSRCLMRLRETAGRSILTFKGPSEEESRYKVREEIEVEVSQSEALRQILFRLGFKESFRYQKWRTEFLSGALPGGHILLDETPIGAFLEVEGEPEWIDHIAARLGFTEGDYILKSYALLFYEACAQQKTEAHSMLFDPSLTP